MKFLLLAEEPIREHRGGFGGRVICRSTVPVALVAKSTTLAGRETNPAAAGLSERYLASRAL